MAYDLIIRGGTLVDGSGEPARKCDIGIEAGRIVERGRIRGPARRTIDADGLVVSPGFVDFHTHYDAQVTWDPLCTPSSNHGVTSVLMGNCGYALAPARPEDRDYLMGLFGTVEQVSKDVLRQGVPWEWESQGDYYDWLRTRGLGINVAAQVGHSAVRRFVMGPEAHERPAKPDEVGAMAALVREGLESGAIGFTTSRVAHQKGEHGEPTPSFAADEPEVFALARVLRELDRGILGINPRTKAAEFVQTDRDQLVKLARECGRVVHWNDFSQRDEYPGLWRSLLDFMEGAQRDGASIYAVMRCQPLNAHFSLADPQIMLPFWPAGWQEFLKLELGERRRRFTDPAQRSALLRELQELPETELRRYHKLGVVRATREPHRALEGHPLRESPDPGGRDVCKRFIEIAASEDLETEFAFFGVMNGDEGAVETMLRSPATINGISDAGAHLHSLSSADYPTYFLGHWARDRRAFALEDAVQSLTSVPARLAGLSDRGLARPGFAADLCIFDLAELGSAPIEMRNDLPGGGSRMFKEARGIEWVVVNGEILLERGVHTGALPGQILAAAPSGART